MAKGVNGVALRQIQHLFDSGTVVGLSDGQLLQRFAANRDELAFRALVDRHGPMVLGVCRRIVRDPHEAEDVFQAVFLVLVRKAGSVHVEDSLGRWLYTVTRRLAMRVDADLDRRNRREALPDDVNDHRPADDPEQRELLIALHDELGRLPKPYRSVVMLCYLDGLTHEEAARRLCWPLGSVKGRLDRARKLLQARLTRRGLAISSATLTVTFRPVSVSASLLERTLTAAIGFAAGHAEIIPAVTLATGVLTSMFVSKLKLGTTALLAVCIGAYATGAVGEGTPKPAVMQEEPTVKAKPGQAGIEFDVDITQPAKVASIDSSRVDELKSPDEKERSYRESLAAVESEIPKLTARLDSLRPAFLDAKLQLQIGEERAQHLRDILKQVEQRRSELKEETKATVRVPDVKADLVKDKQALTRQPRAPLAREGAMKLMPKYTVGPPDILLVEALEALPGRPITGEHLVRPDGKISLGFYGEINVAGLTLDQVKEAVILQLRKQIKR